MEYWFIFQFLNWIWKLKIDCILKFWGAKQNKTKDYPLRVQTSLARIAIFFHIFQHFGYFCAFKLFLITKVLRSSKSKFHEKLLKILNGHISLLNLYPIFEIHKLAPTWGAELSDGYPPGVKNVKNPPFLVAHPKLPNALSEYLPWVTTPPPTTHTHSPGSLGGS